MSTLRPFAVATGALRAVAACAARRPTTALALLVLVTFARALPGEPVFDDVLNFERNAALREGDLGALVAAPFFREPLNYWRPLTSLAMWLGHQLGMAGVHLLAIVLHGAAARLAYGLARRVLGDPVRALAVAALFALHPLHVEGLAWASAIGTPLGGVMALGCIMAAVRWADGTARWRWGAAACHGGALLAYEPAAVAAVLAVAAAASIAGERLRGRWGALLVPFALVTVVWAAMRALVVDGVAPPADGSTASSACVAGLEIVARGAAATIWPWPASPFRALWCCGAAPAAPEPALATFALVALAACACAARRCPAAQRLGVTWLFLPLLLPAALAAHLGEFQLADRYLYVPVLGTALLAGTVLRPRLLVVPIVLLGTGSVVQCGVWRDPRALATHGVACAGAQPIVHTMLGDVELADARQGVPGALARANASYGEALRAIGGTESGGARAGAAHAGRAWCEVLEQQHYGRAPRHETLATFQRVVEVDPRNVSAWVGLGVVHALAGRFDQAQHALQSALRIDPLCPEAWFDLGYLQLEHGRVELARESVARALRCDPGLQPAKDLLARMR